jgi:type IV pilus assembly protein PilY1
MSYSLKFKVLTMTRNNFLKFGTLALAIVSAIFTSMANAATDVSKTPLIPSSVAKPNVIFGIDDSGSMDFEVMLATNDGALWWNDTTVLNGTTGAGWDSNGAPLYNTNGNSGGGWTKLINLFPNGCSSAAKVLCDNSGHYSIAPTYQFAWLRSAKYNSLYYNPAINYTPWTSAYISGALKTFSDATPASALSHPLFTTTFNLTTDVTFPANNNTNQVFQMQPGMVVPTGGKIWKNNNWVTQASNYTVPAGVAYDAAISYYPATYWVPQTCTVNNTSCTRAPDGSTLQRYEIKSGNTFPSGRAYAAELQNFANWFTYYRKRKLMLAASTGTVLGTLTGMRLGVVEFNSHQSVTMYDSDQADPSKNAKAILGKIYANDSSGGTPTRETLNYIGNQLKTNTSIITLSCQKNAAFIMTDGFANATSVTPPSYNSAAYGATAPYTKTYAGSLADIALSYYTNNIRADLPVGKVPASSPTTANPQNDGNANLHMNTYAMTLGAQGTLWPAVTNAYTSNVSWPNPNVNRSPTAVDDLWHATVNGRGQMFTAKDSAETAQSIQSALSNILATSGSQSAVAFSTVNIRPDEAMGFVGSYTPAGWSGDISAYPVDVKTGAMASSASSKIWSADALLQSRGYTTRAIATYSGSEGVPIGDTANWAALSSKVPSTVANFVAYLRGQRINESTTYRSRAGLIGPVVNAEPVSWLADNVVYAASNEGMLHAFDKATGTELWAYVPKFSLENIVENSKIGASFSAILDGTPVVAKVSSSQTILVGGRGTAGTGFYALDVTTPRGAGTQTDSDVAKRVLWEFPTTGTPAAVVSAMGTSTGKPLLVNTARWGWVALVTSGYNSTLDGKGRLFVLNAKTGALLDTLVTSGGSTTLDAGLNSVSGFTEADNTVNYVYGGDLLGNLWKFNIETSSVTRLATLTNASNIPLPITAAPELASYAATQTAPARRMVYVGTGRLLGSSDFTDTSVNSFFGLWDTGTEINPGYSAGAAATNVRNYLAPRVITVGTNGVRTASGVVATSDNKSSCTGDTKAWTNGSCFTQPGIDWATQRGWFVSMPAGEKANTDPSLGLGVMSWTTNSPSLTTCSSSSALYYADAETGLQLAADRFPDGNASYGVAFSTTLASRPVIAKLPSGQLTITTHQSDNSTSTTTLNGAGGATAYVKKGKIAWRQVLQ